MKAWPHPQPTRLSGRVSRSPLTFAPPSSSPIDNIKHLCFAISQLSPPHTTSWLSPVFPSHPSASAPLTSSSLARTPSGSSTRSATTGRRLLLRSRPRRLTGRSSARSSSTPRARTVRARRALAAVTLYSTSSTSSRMARAHAPRSPSSHGLLMMRRNTPA